MFNQGGEIKITKSKSTLKLQVVISERNCPIPETFIYDVSAFLWVLTWPSDQLLVYVDAFLLFVHQALHKSDVTLVFGRYFPNSTNNFTRIQRARLNRVHKLTPEMPAPAKPVILTNTKNKIHLNAMLVEGPPNSDYYTNATQKHTLTTAVVVVVSGVPVEIVDSLRIDRHDICATHEQADIITQHAISCLLSGKCGRGVVCEDTDVLVLLVHFYHIKGRGRNSAPMNMTSLVKERAGIDIGTTATAHSGIADDLLAIYVFSGSYTVTSLHGVGKAIVSKITKKGTLSLSKVGDVKADMKSVQAQATKFICAACGKVAEPCTSMTECRVKMWRSKTGKSGVPSCNSAPFHQQMMRSSKTSTDVTCKSQHRKQHFLNHHRQRTEQVMAGTSTTRASCYHEQCQQAHYLHLLTHCNCKTSGWLTATCICAKV